MDELISNEVQCPYCGEYFEVLVDGSIPHQKYIEDCEVCCRPINFDISVGEEGEVSVAVADENQ